MHSIQYRNIQRVPFKEKIRGFHILSVFSFCIFSTQLNQSFKGNQYSPSELYLVLVTGFEPRFADIERKKLNDFYMQIVKAELEIEIRAFYILK